VIDSGAIERIAQLIHRKYLASQRMVGRSMDGEGPMRPWSQLPDDLRQSNRGQARDILAKLAAIGCDVVPQAQAAAIFRFRGDEVERLSRWEHDRWMAERISQGWTYGPVRDNDRKIHPLLVPYEDLEKAEQDKDRAAVRNIPGLLGAVGLRIIRRRP
jgi:hypothetical protein